LLEGQLKQAGASVAAHTFPGGHGWDEDGRDITLSRSWLDAAGL
jgi:predicted esterase